MTAPNAMLIPGLMAGTQVGGLITGMQPLVTTTLSTPSYTFEPSNSLSSRYVLASSLATIALGSVLAGCSEPHPAPMANETAAPPNQRPCAPENHSRYCEGQRSVLSRMEHDRAEGHHADQSLFFIGGGLALTVGLGIGLFFGIRRGKKVARREAAKADQSDQPPESGPTRKRGLRAFFGNIGSAFRRTKAREESQPPSPPAEPPQSEAASAQDVPDIKKDPKVGT